MPSELTFTRPLCSGDTGVMEKVVQVMTQDENTIHFWAANWDHPFIQPSKADPAHASPPKMPSFTTSGMCLLNRVNISLMGPPTGQNCGD